MRFCSINQRLWSWCPTFWLFFCQIVHMLTQLQTIKSSHFETGAQKQVCFLHMSNYSFYSLCSAELFYLLFTPHFAHCRIVNPGRWQTIRCSDRQLVVYSFVNENLAVNGDETPKVKRSVRVMPKCIHQRRTYPIWSETCEMGASVDLMTSSLSYCVSRHWHQISNRKESKHQFMLIVEPWRKGHIEF